MIKVYTIGFTKKTAKQFFSILSKNNIDTVVDIRLNNSSQLAGFSKYPDIEFFLECLIGLYRPLSILLFHGEQLRVRGNGLCNCTYETDVLEDSGKRDLAVSLH